MSELKYQLMLNKDMSWVPCYLKSDADGVINELKGTIAQLEDDVAYWKTKYLDLKQKEFKCKN